MMPRQNSRVSLVAPRVSFAVPAARPRPAGPAGAGGGGDHQQSPLRGRPRSPFPLRPATTGQLEDDDDDDDNLPARPVPALLAPVAAPQFLLPRQRQRVLREPLRALTPRGLENQLNQLRSPAAHDDDDDDDDDDEEDGDPAPQDTTPVRPDGHQRQRVRPGARLPLRRSIENLRPAPPRAETNQEIELFHPAPPLTSLRLLPSASDPLYGRTVFDRSGAGYFHRARRFDEWRVAASEATMPPDDFWHVFMRTREEEEARVAIERSQRSEHMFNGMGSGIAPAWGHEVIERILPPPGQAVDFNTDISTHYSHHSLQEETGLPPLHRHNRLFLRIRRHLSRRTPDETYIDPRYAHLQISEDRIFGLESAVPAHAVANETVAGPSTIHAHPNETVAGPSAVHTGENITAAVHADDNAAENDNDNDNASNASIIVTRPRTPGFLNLLRTASTRIPSRLSLRGPSRLQRTASRMSARVPSRLNRAASRISNLRVASRMSNLDPTPKTIRIAVVGDSFVGKTCLLNRLLTGSYTPTGGPSQEYRAADHTMTVDGNPVIIEAWDIPGHIPDGTDNPLMSAFFHAAFICFDLENSHRTNIMDTIPYRLTELRSCLVEAPVFVVGLKKDARPSFPMLRLPFLNEPHTISKDVGEKEARRIRAVGYFECSAKTGEGVDELFEAAARYVVNKRDEDERMRSRGGKLKKSLGKKSRRLSHFFSGDADPDLE